jgi:hypothetical protein
MNRPPRSFEKGVEGRNLMPVRGPGGRKWSNVAEENFRGASVRTLPRPNKRFGSGRVCADAACGTKLSVYNKWDYCWQHEPVHAYIPRGKRKRRAVA